MYNLSQPWHLKFINYRCDAPTAPNRCGKPGCVTKLPSGAYKRREVLPSSGSFFSLSSTAPTPFPSLSWPTPSSLACFLGLSYNPKQSHPSTPIEVNQCPLYNYKKSILCIVLFIREFIDSEWGGYCVILSQHCSVCFLDDVIRWCHTIMKLSVCTGISIKQVSWLGWCSGIA